MRIMPVQSTNSSTISALLSMPFVLPHLINQASELFTIADSPNYRRRRNQRARGGAKALEAVMSRLEPRSCYSERT